MPALRGRALLVLLAVAIAATGCRTTGLQFVVDERVRFTAPADRATVRLPFLVEWEVTGFEVTGPDGQQREDAGSFAVVVDRSPPKPYAPLSSLAADDEACRPADGCPDATWYADHGIYPTSATSLLLEQLPQGEPGRREVHELTLVLLDGTGRRIGENAFDLVVEVDRRPQAAATP